MAHAAVHWNGVLHPLQPGGDYQGDEHRDSSHTKSEVDSSSEPSAILTYCQLLNTEGHHTSASSQPEIRVPSPFTQHRAYTAIVAGRCELLRDCLINTAAAVDNLVKPAATAADSRLLQKLLPVDAEFGSSYLHVVADAAQPHSELRFVPMIHELGLAGVDPQIADKKGRTALDIAVAKNLWDVTLALIRIGATASRETGQRFKSNRAALDATAVEEAAAAIAANRTATLSANQQCRVELVSHVPPLGQAVREGDYGRVMQLLSRWHRVANVRNGDELLTDTAMRLHAETRALCEQQGHHEEQPHQPRHQQQRQQQQQEDRSQHSSTHQHRQTSSAGDEVDDTVTPEAAAQASAAAVLEAIEAERQQDEQLGQKQQQTDEKTDARKAQRRAKVAHVLRHYERPAEFVQAVLAGNVARMRDLAGGVSSPAECIALLALACGEQFVQDGNAAASPNNHHPQQRQQPWQQQKPKGQLALRKAAERLGHGAAVTEMLDRCLAAASSTVAAAGTGIAARAACRTGVATTAATAETQVAAVKGNASRPPGANDYNITGQTYELCPRLARQESTTRTTQPTSVSLSNKAAVPAAEEAAGCMPPPTKNSPKAAPFELEIRVPSPFTEHRAYAAITGGSCEMLRDCLNMMATAAESSAVDGRLPLPADAEFGSSYLHVTGDAARPDTELRFVPMIHELALAGVDPQIADNRGRTALDIAMAKGLHELSVALLRVGATASREVRSLLTENLCRTPAADVIQPANDTADGSQVELQGSMGPYAQATPLGQAVQDGDYGRVMQLLSRWHRVANVRHGDELLTDVAMRLHAETRALCEQQHRHEEKPHKPRHQQHDRSQHSSTHQHRHTSSASDDVDETVKPEAAAQASAAAVLEAIEAEQQQDEHHGQQQRQTEETANVREAQRRAKVAHVLRHYERPAEFVQAVLAGNVARMRDLAGGASSPAECVALLALACGEQFLTDGSTAVSRRRRRHPQRKSSQQHKQELTLCDVAERLGHSAAVTDMLRSYLAAAADTVAAAAAASQHATATAKFQTASASTATDMAAGAAAEPQKCAVHVVASSDAETAAVIGRCSVESAASTSEADGCSGGSTGGRHVPNFRYQVPAYGQEQSKPIHSAACSIL